MISTFLVEHSALVPVALLLVVLVCAGLGYLVLRVRHRHERRILWALVVLSVLPVVALTLVPTPHEANQVCAFELSVPRLGSVELLANVALFIPPVFFAALATRRPLLVLAAGVGTSAAIEALQAAVPAIGRSCDANDWTMNTAGAVIAVLLVHGTIGIADRAAVGR